MKGRRTKPQRIRNKGGQFSFGARKKRLPKRAVHEEGVLVRQPVPPRPDRPRHIMMLAWSIPAMMAGLLITMLFGFNVVHVSGTLRLVGGVLGLALAIIGQGGTQRAFRLRAVHHRRRRTEPGFWPEYVR